VLDVIAQSQKSPLGSSTTGYIVEQRYYKHYAWKNKKSQGNHKISTSEDHRGIITACTLSRRIYSNKESTEAFP